MLATTKKPRPRNTQANRYSVTCARYPLEGKVTRSITSASWNNKSPCTNNVEQCNVLCAIDSLEGMAGWLSTIADLTKQMKSNFALPTPWGGHVAVKR